MTDDPLIAAARFLLAQLEWMRHATDEQGGPYAVAAFAEIERCAGRLRGLVEGPPPKKYLGPCGAVLERCKLYGIGDHDCACHYPCEGDVYGVRGAQRGRCRTCGAEVDQDDRRVWLDEEVRLHAFRAWQLAEVYRINVNTIRSWALRGRLASYWRTETGIVAVWTDPPEGEARERLHYVGDVLDLYAADRARLAEGQAKRARRAADRAAGDERLSA